MKDQIRSPKPPRSVGFRWVLVVRMALQNVTFSKSRKIKFRTAFRSVLGAQNRPKTIPKHDPKRLPNPAWFLNRV